MKVKTKKTIFVLVVGSIILAWALAVAGCRCLSCEPTMYYSPSGKPFPTAWGKPPKIQTKDYRPLPYGYGHGSSTLHGWITSNKEKETQHRLNNLPDTILLDTISGPGR